MMLDGVVWLVWLSADGSKRLLGIYTSRRLALARARSHRSGSRARWEQADRSVWRSDEDDRLWLDVESVDV